MFLVFSCWRCCYECSNIYVSRAMCTDFPGHVYSGGIVGSQGLCILNFLGNTSLFPYNLVLLCILSLILWFLIIFSHLFFPKRICLQLLIGTWIPSFFSSQYCLKRRYGFYGSVQGSSVSGGDDVSHEFGKWLTGAVRVWWKK